MQKDKELKTIELQKSFEIVKSSLTNLNKTKEELLCLTDLSLTELQGKITDKSTNPIELLKAFQLKGLELLERGNSGICEFIQEAEQHASQLNNNSPLETSELFGIPISIIELCCVHGYDATYGLTKLCQKPSEKDCVVVKALKRAGAIPFVLTATSQGALTMSGFNPIFGDMRNPFSDKYEPGGSSSGEAVLLAQNGSPVGIGTDLAGGIRIPCAFCGLAGLKPTTRRVSRIGLSELTPESSIELAVSVGPMGKRVDDLAKVMRTLLTPYMFELDSNIPMLPFNNEVYSGKDKHQLVIGYYDTLDDSNIIQTVPSVRGAIEQAVEILKDRGHHLVKFTPPTPYLAFELGVRAVALDGLKAVAKMLSGEPLDSHSKALIQLASVPGVFRSGVDAVVRRSKGKPAALCNLSRKFGSVSDLMKHVKQIEKYRAEFAKAWKEASDFDALIGPVWAYPAPRVDTLPCYIAPSLIYTILYNVLDYPAGSVPMGHVTNEDIKQAHVEAQISKQSGDKYNEQILLMQADTAGLPLAVQVIAKPFREELVLRVMSELEAGVQSRSKQ